MDTTRLLEARYKSILDSSHDAIVSVDEAQRIVSFNRGAEQTFGYRSEEVLGQPLDILLPEELAARHRHEVETFASTGCTARGMGGNKEVAARRKNGETFPALASISRVEVEGEYILTAFLRDITEHRRLQDQLRQAQKMEALGRLAGGIAHDYNNMLLGILGFAELLGRGLGDGDPRRRLVDDIRGCAKRSAALTRQLLLFSRQQVAEPQPLDLNAVVAGMENILRRLLGEGIEIRTTFAAELGTINMDPSQLEQVLLNLAVNARDAMAHAGRIEIRTHRGEIGRDRPGLEQESCAVLTVADTGCGIDPEIRTRIFEPFFTTKEPGEGTGLGLSTVFGIVSSAGGHIEVDSAPGEGATFTVCLPVSGETPGRAGDEIPAEIRRGRETVLVVDDEEVICRLATELLAQGGYDVLAAQCSGEALLLAEQHEGPIHLLLTDVVMAHMNGPELAERLHGERPEMKVLYMTGHPRNVLPNFFGHGVPLIRKPFSADDLARKVGEVLDGVQPWPQVAPPMPAPQPAVGCG